LALSESKDGLDQDNVDIRGDERSGRLGIDLDRLVEIRVACARVVDVRRDAGGLAGRAAYGGDKPGLVGGLGGPGVGDLAGESRRGRDDLCGIVLRTVVGLGQAIAVEGVGLEDIGAGPQVLLVDRANHLGLGQGQQVVSCP
jgi:hypothetical protein